MTTIHDRATDLCEGDVIEARHPGWPEGQVIRGPVGFFGAELRVAGYTVNELPDPWVLTVVSRAPRPLYVNHHRAEPVPGDVVRDADQDHPGIWVRARRSWVTVDGDQVEEWKDAAPHRLRLLVDGETGQVVQ